MTRREFVASVHAAAGRGRARNHNHLVEVVFESFTQNTTTRSAQVGLRGASNADFNNRSSTTGWTNEDGGVTWSSLRSWNSDHGVLFGLPGVYVTLDLADYLGQSNPMLRWRYFSNSSQALAWQARRSQFLTFNTLDNRTFVLV
jgi:hypothetical protein